MPGGANRFRKSQFLSEIGMSDDLAALQSETEAAIAAAADLRALDAVRVGALGKSGQVTALLKGLGTVPAEERKARGGAVNAVRQAVERALEARKAVLEEAALEARLAAERLDVSLPPRPHPPAGAESGAIHPIARTVEELTAIFGAMGFAVAEGPDIESDWYNFNALNIPGHHPARQDQDTFYLPPAHGAGFETVLRTHTSPVQARTMLSQEPPIRVIVPGRTYRADHDATHSPMFHQVEGLVIGRDITLGHLKGCLIDFLRAFFGIADLPVRFRSSYFPFTEPSMEVDIQCSRKGGEIRFGEGDDWLEILGCGMVHPNVLRNCGLDPDVYQGFAWGMGIDRIAMLKYGMPDLRAFFDADVRWMNHYGFRPLDMPTLFGGLSA